MMSFFVLIVTIVNSIHYSNIADDDNIGLLYSRTYGSEWDIIFAPYLSGGSKPDRLPFLRQNPGVAILDFNNDGFLDIFVSNGPGKAHSLFKNKLDTLDNLTFEDVGIQAGFGDITALNHDGSGVCFADIDNDDYDDILILGRNELNLLYKNNGDGTFSLISNNGITQNTKQFNSASCSFGDINNDGYVDVVIGNAANMLDMMDIVEYGNQMSEGTISDAYKYNEFNELYLNNNGDGTFEDISDRIKDTVFDSIYHGIYNGKPTITWAIQMFDINNDGFLDIIHADDSLGHYPPEGYPRGIIHIFLNAGNGYFTDVPVNKYGKYMGAAAGDLNCDGNLDLFLTDFGGAESPSQWYFGDGKGGLSVPNRNRSKTRFGWGTAMLDYDNDGDIDILYHGGIAVSAVIVANNPGTIIENVDGCFNTHYIPPAHELFETDKTCVSPNGDLIEECTIHIRRNVRGLAIGDLNNDGFYDIITTSDEYFGIDFPGPFRPPWQETEFWFPSYSLPVNPWKPEPGDLAVEIANKQDNNNNYFHVIIKGSKNILNCGLVNRDAIGVLLTVTIEGGSTVTIPIEGGSSHLSQHSLQKIFGMGSQQNANLSIKYPSKNGKYIVNKLNNIQPKEKNLILYEIPCDYYSKQQNVDEYRKCVKYSLCTLNEGGFISNELSNRLYNNALDIDEIINCQNPINTESLCHDGHPFVYS